MLMKSINITLMTRDVVVLLCCCEGLRHHPSEWPGSCSQDVSNCSPVWPGLTYPVWLRGLSVSFPLLVIKTSPPFSMLSQRLLDPPHRRGDLVSTAWRWIKDGLAMAGRGREGQMVWGMQQKESQEERNGESVLSLCGSICCGKLCNLFKSGSLLWERGCRITFNRHSISLSEPEAWANRQTTPQFNADSETTSMVISGNLQPNSIIWLRNDLVSNIFWFLLFKYEHFLSWS